MLSPQGFDPPPSGNLPTIELASLAAAGESWCYTIVSLQKNVPWTEDAGCLQILTHRDDQKTGHIHFEMNARSIRDGSSSVKDGFVQSFVECFVKKIAIENASVDRPIGHDRAVRMTCARVKTSHHCA